MSKPTEMPNVADCELVPAKGEGYCGGCIFWEFNHGEGCPEDCESDEVYKLKVQTNDTKN